MKLHISSSRNVEVSSKATAVIDFVNASQSDLELAKYLDSNFQDDFFEVEDLRCWGPVLEKFDGILIWAESVTTTLGSSKVTVNHSSENVFIVVTVLRFLGLLLKSASDKRYFFSIEPVRCLLRCTDIDIALLAAEVLFNVCVPANSVLSASGDDNSDIFEVPTSVANDALLSFEALSLMSTEFGVTEYLHGHQPAFVGMRAAESGTAETYLSMRFPPRIACAATVDMDLTAWPTEFNNETINTTLNALQKEYELTADELLTVHNVKLTLRGLQSGQPERLKVVRLRLCCFFMLVHSKVTPSVIQEYIRPSSRFMLDLVELSDLASEACGELSLPKPVVLSYLALENVLGLLENKLRRKSSFAVQSNIMQMLGLSSAFTTPLASSARTDGAWTAIVMSACAAVPGLLNSEQASTSVPGSPSSSSSPTKLIGEVMSKDISANGKFVRIALELFALSIATRDASHVVSDAPLISTIIGVVQSTAPHIERIFEKRKVQGASYVTSAYDTHVLLIASKALYCTELLLERAEYLGAFREADGIAAVSRILEIFSVSASTSEDNTRMHFVDHPSRNVLEGAFCSLYLSIKKSRHTVMLQGNTSDTGMLVVYETYFSDLCNKLFSSSYHKNELLWAQLVTVIKEAIDLDPSYLGHFLQSSYAATLLTAVMIPFGAPFPSSFFAPEDSTDLDNFLVPLARLASSVSITPEGREYLTRSRIVYFILEAVFQPCCLLPSGHEIEPSRLMKLGKIFGQMIIEHEELRSPIKDQLKKRLIAAAREAADCFINLKWDDGSELSSPRIQALHKLTYICTIVENTFSERRVRNDDVMRDVLAQSALEALVSAFPATLPTPRQLFSQLAVRHVTTSPHYGHSASAKAVTSLIKYAATQVTHSSLLITMLCKELEQHLTALNNSIAELRKIDEATAAAAGENSTDESGEKDFPRQLLPPIPPVTVKSTPPPLLLSILETFPHRSVIDPLSESVPGWGAAARGRKSAYVFLTSLLSIEWTTMLLAQSVRTDQRVPHSRSVVVHKDTFKKLFAFHKSSLLEVCRFSSSKWTSKPLTECRFKRTMPDSLCRFDSVEDIDFIPRIPHVFHLRVAGSGGALVREGIEIEGSRVVLVAEVGSTMTASERRVNDSMVMRYRIAHGWMSEFRRDHQRSPIVELIDIAPLTAEEIEKEKLDRAALKSETEINDHCVLETLTLRESACLCLIKCNAAMRQVSVYLARSMFNTETSLFGRSSHNTPSSSAPILSVTLSKLVDGFLSLPGKCIPPELLPTSGISDKGDMDGLASLLKGTQIGEVGSSTSGTPKGSSSSLKGKKGNKPDEMSTTDADIGHIDLTTMCLYYGAAVKQFLLPVLEDKNGNINVMLLRTLCNHGVSEKFCDAFSTLIHALRIEISKIPPGAATPELSPTGRCALNSLPVMLTVIQRLSSQEIMIKSISGGNVSQLSSVNLTDEIGPYQVHELFYQVLSALRGCIAPLMDSKATKMFPSDLQHDWLAIVCELLQSLSATLPAPGGVRRRSLNNPGTTPTPASQRMFGAMPTTPRRTPVPVPHPDPQMVDMLVEMGFAREQVNSAVSSLRTSNIDTITQYMFTHPWTPSVAAGVVENPTLPSVSESSTPPPPVASADMVNSAGVPESSGAGANDTSVPLPSATVEPEAQADSETVVHADLTPVPTSSELEVVGTAVPAAFGALPNLVTDLDAADAGGSHPSEHATLSITSAASGSSDSEGNATPAPSNGEAAMAVMERFRESMDLLMGDVGSVEGRLNRVPGIRRPSSMVASPDESGDDWSPSRLLTGDSAKADAITKSDTPPSTSTYMQEHVTHQNRLSSWAGELSDMIVPNMLETCLHYDQVVRWDSKESHMLIPFMIEVLQKLKQGSTPAKKLSFASIFSQLTSLLEGEVSKHSSEGSFANLHGVMYFLNQLIMEPTIRKDVVVRDETVMRERFIRLVDLVLRAVRSVITSQNVQWPKWISPAMLLLYELLSLPGNDSSRTNASFKTAAGSRSSIGDGAGTVRITNPGDWDEKEEKDELCESKVESESDPAAAAVIQNTSNMLLNQVQLLSDSVRVGVFDLALRVLQTLPTSQIDPDSMQGVLIVILTLLNNQKLVDQFVAAGGLATLLSITRSGTSAEHLLAQFRVITLIVRRCMETSVELEQQFSERIRDWVRAKRSEDKCVSFDSFIRAMTPDLLRSPDDFWKACRRSVKIIKVQSVSKSERNDPRNKPEIKVRLLDNDHSQQDLLTLRVKAGEPDHRAYVTLCALLHHVVIAMKRTKNTPPTTEDIASHMLTVSGALNAVADAILSLRRAPVLAAKLICSDSDSISLSGNDNFADFLISSFSTDRTKFPADSPLFGLVECNPFLTASTRLWVALCAFKGPSRTLTLAAIIKNFKMHCAKTPAYGDDREHVQIISRFASLIGLVIRASKNQPTKDASSSKGQGVSVDTLQFLVEQGQILQLLTQALNTIPMHLTLSSGAVSSLMDLIEMITRPKILTHLEKSMHSAMSGAKGKTDGSRSDTIHVTHDSHSHHSTEDIFLMSAEDNGFGRSRSPGDGLGADPLHFHDHHQHEGDDEESEESEESGEEDEEEEHDGDEYDDEDEDEEDDEEEGDEEEHEHGYADAAAGQEGSESASSSSSSSSSDSRSESSADSGVGEENHQQNEFQSFSSLPDNSLRRAPRDETVDLDNYNEDAEDSYVNVEAANRVFPDIEQLMEGLIFEPAEVNMEGNAFITPPNRINQDFSLTMGINLNSEDPLADLTDVIRQYQAASMNNGISGYSGRAMSSTHDDGRVSEMTVLLPQGVAAALEVAPMVIQHPMLGRDSMIPLHVRGTPVAPPGVTNMGTLFAGMQAPQFQRRNAINQGMIPLPPMISRSARSGMLQMSPFQHPGGESGQDGRDIASPAMWPRYYRTSEESGASTTQRRDSLSQQTSSSSDLTDGMARFLLQQLEDRLISGMELTEESPDEVSQGSFTETSRGDGGQTEGAFSFSEQSNIAMQDPNPRRRGEADSRTGDPIPPIIEIDSRGHEGNEEMSVITLPQDEANQAADHDDTSVNTHHSAQDLARMLRSVAESSSSARTVSPGHRSPVHSVQFSPGTVPLPPVAEAGESSPTSMLPPAPPTTLDSAEGSVSESTEDVEQQSTLPVSPPPSVTAPLDPFASVAGIAFDSLLLSMSTSNPQTPTAPAAPTAPAVLLDAADTVNSVEPSPVAQETAPAEPQSATESSAPELSFAAAALTETTNTDESVAVVDNSSPMIVDGGEAPDGSTEEAAAAAAETAGRLPCPAGYDADVFYLLPEDMQQEIIEQHTETTDQTQQLIEAAGMDYETFQALPESIRQEVLDQARRDQQAASREAGGSGGGGESTAAQEMDNASFLASLTPDLRAEVLLTADPTFLASLPPELIAEAQSVRERVASSWQRRELMSRMGAREGSGGGAAPVPPPGATAPGRGIGGPGEFYGDEEDDDEEEEDEEDDDGLFNALVPRNRARNGAQNPARSKAADRPKSGLMRVSGSSSYSSCIPRDLLLSVVRVLLTAPKHPARSTSSYRIIQNVCGDLSSKDLNLKLLLSLIGENRNVLMECLSQISGRDANLSLLMGEESSVVSSDLVSRPTLNCAKRISPDSDVTVSPVAALRIITVLTHLVSSSSTCVYLLLSERDPRLVLTDTATAARLQEIKKIAAPAASALSTTSASATEESAADSTANALASAESEDIHTKPSVEESTTLKVGGCARMFVNTPASTNSLLEILISLLSSPHLTTGALELDALANLLCAATAPLDQLKEDETAIEISTEMVEHDAKHNSISVAVPKVIVSKDSLGYLCDVLLNDLCNKRVLLNITSVISRLSKVPSNLTLLLELIADVIVDLADQSQAKLENLTSSLKQIQQKYEVFQREKGKASSGSNIDASARATTASTKIGGMEVSAGSPQRASRNGAAPNAKKTLPTTLLPLGESGSKQHDRLLRVVQTLHSMALKTKRQLSEVTPADELIRLWKGIDDVLSQLRLYLVDEEDEEGGEKESGATMRPQSALTSILNRLLPALESFFLVHASDFLIDKARSNPLNSEKERGEVTVATEGTPAATTLSTAASTTNTSELIHPSSMPGHSYRNNVEYQRNNISLFTNDTAAPSIEDGSPLLSTRSLRKQSSLTSMNSRTYSVLTSKAQRLLQFVQNHKGLLNLVIKSRPSLLDDSFSAFVRVKEIRACLKFDNKRKYFFAQLTKRSNMSASRRGVHLQIRRNQVFEDSFHQLRVRTAEELRGRLQVNFFGEEGVDAGGLSREWYVILAREIFNPNYALFTAAADGATFQPNPLSIINSNHLDYFKFVGRLIGKAICDGQLMDAHFTRSFYKHLLGMPVDFQDIEATEPDYYKTLRQILETPLDLLMMDLTFSAEIQKFGNTEVVDLIPNGRNIAVTDENKFDYIRLVAHHRMTSAIRSQIDSFLQGFYDLVPAELISIFSPAELELLVCGLPDVNIDELQQHTDYHQYKASDEQIVWFWETLRSFNREERASFLQFVTGTSKVPLGGFANLQGMRGNQRFSIHKAYGDGGLLPSAHTCFNQLDLPVYKSADELREKLLTAITEGAEGFGFA